MASYARVLAVVVCLCVCLSVTRRYCIKTAKRRIRSGPLCHIQIMERVVKSLLVDHLDSDKQGLLPYLLLIRLPTSKSK